jgi:hypothetical protein
VRKEVKKFLKLAVFGVKVATLLIDFFGHEGPKTRRKLITDFTDFH